MGKLMDRKDNVFEDNCEQIRIPMSPSSIPNSPLDLSKNSKQFPFRGRSPSPKDTSIQNIENIYRQMSVDDDEYDAPEIFTQPKREWHYRSIKDLAKKHLPYVAGNGPQRTPIRVRVPPRRNRRMYLAMAIKTIDNEPHPSKVIVPAKTHVNTEHISHDNNLNCLRFDECNPADYFDIDNRYIYSEISLAEHQAGYKEVRIHMFNLYQNRLITKEVIEVKQLNQCKLAFWLCIEGDRQYVPVSQPSFSVIIEEKKMSTRSRASVQTNQPISMSGLYSQFLIDNIPEDDVDEDDSF